MNEQNKKTENCLQEGVLIVDAQRNPKYAFRPVLVEGETRFRMFNEVDQPMTAVLFTERATVQFVREYTEPAGWKAYYGNVDELWHELDNASEPDKNDVPYDGPQW
jgi:hypothetical protein